MFKPFERYLQPTAVPEHPEPPARPARLLVAFRAPGQRLFVALFVGRILRRAHRQRGALVHGPHRHAGDHDRAGTLPRRDLAVARRHGAGGAGRASRHRAAALSHHQPGDRSTVHRPDPLAGALARRAPELGVLPERFRRPHLQPRDADRPGGAPDAGRLGHRALVHAGLRRHRDRDDGRRRRLAHDADPAVGSRAMSRCCGISCRACATAPRSARRRARR